MSTQPRCNLYYKADAEKIWQIKGPAVSKLYKHKCIQSRNETLRSNCVLLAQHNDSCDDQTNNLQFGLALVKPRSLRNDRTVEIMSRTWHMLFSTSELRYWYCKRNTIYWFFHHYYSSNSSDNKMTHTAVV